MAQKKSLLTMRAEYALASLLMCSLRWLPLPASNRLARAFTQILDFAVPKLRKVGRKNLAFAFPHYDERDRERILDGVFRAIARLLVALARFPLLDPTSISEWISYEGLEHYRAAKQKGRGVLIATGHLGNWELSAFAHAILTEPMYVMVRPLDNPLIDRLVEERRALSGNHLIQKKDAARAVIKALRDNQPVGILIDQNTGPTEGVFVNFFGQKACAGSAFVKLAYHSEAPVIPGFAIWDESTGRYVLRFYPEVKMSGDVGTDTQRIHSALEEIVRKYPDQWMWIHRRWKTRPPSEPSLY